MNVTDLSVFGQRCCGHNTYRDLQTIDLVPFPDEKKLDDDTLSADEQLLRNIFSIDPVTKLPSGDIAIFVNKNTSDSVRKYIQENLLHPMNADHDSSGYPDLSDDDIALYTRSADETVYQYRDRLLSALKENSKVK